MDIRGAVRAGRSVVLVLAVVGVVLLLRSAVIGWYPVSTDSMAPTVDRGDRVLVDRLGWRLAELHRGDLVTFESPQSGELLLKRIVAVAGDRVTIEDAVLVVNGERVSEPYVDHSRVDGLYFGPVTVPDGHVFVLGDNRFGSIDSRVYGPVPISSITGRVLWNLH